MIFTVVQALVLTGVLLVALWVAFGKLAPKLRFRWQGRLAMRLLAPGHGAFSRWLGRHLQPALAQAGGCGTGNGCSSCSGCAPAPRQNEQEIFRSRP